MPFDLPIQLRRARIFDSVPLTEPNTPQAVVEVAVGELGPGPGRGTAVMTGANSHIRIAREPWKSTHHTVEFVRQPRKRRSTRRTRGH